MTEISRERAAGLARRDADSESMENLEAADAIWDKLADRTSHNALMVQDDVWGTLLPNGLLRWFGFEFERAELPDEGLLPHDERPRWVGNPPIFIFRTGVADAGVKVSAEGMEIPEDTLEEDDGYAVPSLYRVEIRAHGLEHPEEFTCRDWHEVQMRCRQLERRLDDSHGERHAGCTDEQGESSPEACLFCERGMPGG